MLKLHYAYDAVSNITDVVNSAPQLSNGLGGDYDNSYGYDNLYRLSSAEGHWYGVSPLSYNLSMSYFDNGRICKKVLTAGTLLNGNFSAVSYGRYYHYNTTSQQNTIIGIDGSEIHGFQWDATGNLIYHRFDRIPGERFLCWDEANRLQGVRDDEYLSFYQYDANGERTYKLTGKPSRQNVSGRWSATYVLDNPTLYPSPYMVVTPKGYTKHYYVENERIASRIGGGGLIEIDTPVVKWEDVEEKININGKHLFDVMECLRCSDVSVKNTLKEIYKYKYIINQEDEGYWYHPDHLGSSSWITYSDGSAVQHLHYLPWGEDFVDQRSTNWNAMYTFSAKEKDTETGYSYFGARYYSSDLSIWLSVDPMAAKYPSLSPYVYCANNPIKLVDPNGEELWKPEITGTGDIRLLSEEGDSYQSLTHFLGGKSGIFSKRQIDKMWKNRDEKGNVTLSKNIFSKAIKKAMKLNYPSEEDIMKYKNWAAAERAGYTKNYNCIGASISAAMGEEIGYCFIEKLDDELEYGKWYSTNTPVFGKTLLRFEYEGIATHAAIYFGQDHSGNTYVFSKNGPFPAPKIMLLQDVENIPGYGTVTPLRTNTKRLQGDSGMYNYGRKKSK